MCQILFSFGTLRLAGLELPLRVYGYGLMLVLGFLTGILLARWRARRAGEDPEVISQLAIWALLGGVGGARLAYVIKEWNFYRHAGLGELLNLSSGGLIYFGGLLGGTGLVVLVILLRRLPLRRFLDILAVSIMVGLAFGRAGCLLNGCCWGGPCEEHWPLAIRFPMIARPLVNLHADCAGYVPGQSLCPAYAGEYSRGTAEPDERLLNAYPPFLYASPESDAEPRRSPLPVEDLHGPLQNDQLAGMLASRPEAYRKFRAAAGMDQKLDREEWERARHDGNGLLCGSEAWSEAVRFAPAGADGVSFPGPLSFEDVWRYLQSRKERLLARFDADGDGTFSAPERQNANAYLQADLYALLARQRTPALRPAQPLGIMTALLLAGLLTLFYRHRRREGRVFALMLILYPLARFLLESIRNPDPLNVFHGNWTHNQITSVVLLGVGLAMWWGTGRLPASAGPTLAERMAAGR